MEKEGHPFADVLKDAQELGYAEADPTFDIDGIDAAHKLSILASLSFGAAIAFDQVDVTGIRHEIGRHTSELQSLLRLSYAVFCLQNNIYRHYHSPRIHN